MRSPVEEEPVPASDLPPGRLAAANFIAGTSRPSISGRTYERFNPWRPSEIVGAFPASTSADVDAAVDAATALFSSWALTPAAARGAILMKAADLLLGRVERIARDMTLEMGKPIRESRMEVLRAAASMRYFAGEAWRTQGEVYEQSATGAPVYTRRRPLGPIGLITPWNFPLAIPVWKAAPALVYGNTVILKVAQDAPLCGLHLADCLQEAGLPPGAFNVVIGTGPECGTALVEHPNVRAISFTGSVEVGHRVRERATAGGKRVQLELGGHNPLIVMADADLQRAAEAAFMGAFSSAGQKCTATRRILVEETVYGAFKERLLERVRRGVVGDPMDPETEVGPLVNETQFNRVLEGIEQGRNGGVLVAGGSRVHDEAYLLEPTIFEGIADNAFLSCEEVFGPVTSMYSFASLEEAIRRANAVEFGLSASIFTNRLDAAQRFTDELQAGVLFLNSQTTGADVHVPFGGTKSSGFGPREQGRAAIEFYTETVTVYHNL